MTKEEYKAAILACFEYTCADMTTPDALHEALTKEICRLDQVSASQVLPESE